MKPLSIRETELKEEMKSRCLNKGLYIDENAEEKFKMLCHLEDFEIEYHKLEHNWNELKKWLECMCEVSHLDIMCLNATLNKMTELERGE